MNSFHNNEGFLLLRSVKEERDGTSEKSKQVERVGLTSKLHGNPDDNDALENRQSFQTCGRCALLGVSLFLSFILACVAVLYVGRTGSVMSLFHKAYNSRSTNQKNHADENKVPKQFSMKDFITDTIVQEIMEVQEDFQNIAGNAAKREEDDVFYNRKLEDDNKLVEGGRIKIEYKRHMDYENHVVKKAKDATKAKCPKVTPKPQIAPTRLEDSSDPEVTWNGVYHPGVSMEEDPFEIGHANDFTWYSQPTASECDVSPLPENAACSCWNVSASCCERSVHSGHKWGNDLVRTFFGRGRPYSFGGDVSESNARTRPVEKHGQTILERHFRYPPEYFDRPGGVDYREVFFTRNLFDSLVSGYLYHKAGYECWLHVMGKLKKDYDPTMDNKIVYDSIVQFPEPFTPTRNRSICQYLVDETEWQGMRVYAEWVMRTRYYTTINLYKAVQIHEDPIYRKTLFVCFEDLNSVNVTTKGNVIKRIVKFLYPGGQHDDIKLPTKAKAYSGHHASSHDPEQRKWLTDIARRVDKQVFGGVLANLNKMFGNCGENN